MHRWRRVGPWTVPLGVLWMLTVGASAPDVQFTDVTRAVGIDFKQENSPTSNKYLLETMGGGVALLDYDNDGRLDVFFTNGAKLEDPMPPGRQPDKSDPKLLEPALPSERRTARSPTSPRRRASPECPRTATAWASRWATTTTTASRIST